MEQEYTYEYDDMSQLIRAVLSGTTTTAWEEGEGKTTTAYVTRQYRLQLSDE